MTVILDILNSDPRTRMRPDKPRHPEKAKRPDTPIQSKPAWIRVKAPGSAAWAETKRIVDAARARRHCIRLRGWSTERPPWRVDHRMGSARNSSICFRSLPSSRSPKSVRRTSFHVASGCSDKPACAR
jgi:hypothetical protein